MRLGLRSLVRACDCEDEASKLPYVDCWYEEGLDELPIEEDSLARSSALVLRLGIAMEEDILAVSNLL